MKTRLFTFILILEAFFKVTAAQDISLLPPDTVFVPDGSTIIINKERYLVEKDTFFVIPAGTKYRLRLDRESQGKTFFDSLETKAAKKRWTRELHNIVIRSPKNEPITDTLQTIESASLYRDFEGKIIRDILVSKLDPFGPNVFDTTAQAINSLEKFGNRIHVQTNDRVIKNHLLFKEGIRIRPTEISDNERIIRELPFIEDARIYILEIPGSNDSVDILVIIKDAFSIGLGGEIKDINAGKLEIFDKNVAGTGHQLHSVFYWDGNKNPWIGAEFFHIINNISGSFINSKLRYAQIFDLRTYQAEFERKFFTPNIKYAGAINIERTSTLKNINYTDTTVKNFPIEYNRFDVWLGRSFFLATREMFTTRRVNLVMAARYFKEQYFERPDLTETTLYLYQNKTYVLGSISLSQQRFFRSNLIYSFGVTEDIPQGILASITLGPEYNEFEKRLYIGGSISRGGFVHNQGYLFGKAEFGGFSSEKNYFKQGVLHLQVNYFTNLFIYNQFKFRHFIKLDYVSGINRYNDEFIYLNDKYGIRGFKDNDVRGTKKMDMNYEIVSFSPYYFYGFRFAFFGFLDAGLITESQPVLKSNIYSGFGLGVRIRNERLAFETIQIRIGYYPSYNPETLPLSLNISGEKKLNPASFYATKPDVIRFE